MKNAGWIWKFLLFLWEFLNWTPNEVNTIVERLTLIAFRDARVLHPLGNQSPALIYLVNPAVAILLFLSSAGAFTNFIHETLSQYANPNWIIWINRHWVLRVFAAGFVFLNILQEILNITSSQTLGLIDLYQNKIFWTYLLGGIMIYRLVAPGERE